MKKICKIAAISILFLVFTFPLIALAYKNCPVAEFKVIPEGIIQPGQEFTVQALTEHFSAEEADITNMFYVWCLDNNVVNTINAGSDDKFIADQFEEGFHLENKYGTLESNDLAACKGFRQLDFGGLRVIDVEGTTSLGTYEDSSQINTPPEDWRMKRIPNVDTDNDGLDDNWEVKYFSGRRIEQTLEVPVQTGGLEEYFALLGKVYEEEDDWTCGDVDLDIDAEESEEIVTLEISEYLPSVTDDESRAELLNLVTPDGVVINYDSITSFLPDEESPDTTEEEEPSDAERLEELSDEVAGELMLERLTAMIANPLIIPDPDNDGWKWPYIDGAATWTDDEDDTHTAPGFANSLGIGWFGRPWMIGIPYPQNAATDEITPLGLENPPYYYNLDYLRTLDFNPAIIPLFIQLAQGNSENILTEYNRGTDPLNPDTDSDGVLDAEDYFGRVQDDINLRTQKESGEKYKVALTTFGVTETFRNGEERQYHKYDLVRYPQLYDKCTDDPFESCDPEIPATAAGKDEITVGTGLALKIGWGYSPAPPVAREDESVVVNVKTSRLSEFANLDLKYDWYLDSEGATPWNEEDLEENKSGHDKDSFQFTPNKPACDEHIVGLEITEEKSNRVTFQEMPIPMGFDSNLISNVISNVDLNSAIIKDFNESEGANLADYDFSNIGNDDFILPNDYFKDSINRVNEGGFGMGFRKGDLVEVKLNNIEDGYGEACEAKYGNYNDAKENFYFNWWYTRRKQKIFSGKGLDTENPNDDFSKAYFVVKNDARGTENDGQDTNSLINTGSEFVSVEMLDEEGNVLAKNKENFRVVAPYVDFIVEGAEIGTSQEDTSVPTYYAERGDEIKITSVLNYFRPSNGYDQVWKRNGQVRSELRGSPDMINSTYTFRAGMDINGNELNNNKETITLEVDSTVATTEGSTDKEAETADGTITINLQRPIEGGIDTAVSGAINKFIPSHYRNVFGLFITFGLAGTILVFVLGFMKKTSGKR